MLEAFENWYNFNHDGHKFSLRKEFDEEGDETGKLELAIDGESYTKHPFMNIDFGK